MSFYIIFVYCRGQLIDKYTRDVYNEALMLREILKHKGFTTTMKEIFV